MDCMASGSSVEVHLLVMRIDGHRTQTQTNTFADTTLRSEQNKVRHIWMW